MDYHFNQMSFQNNSRNTQNMPMEGTNYPDALLKRPFMTSKQKSLTTHEYYLTVDSRDRDRTRYPNTNEYRIELNPSDMYTGGTPGKLYKNIESIELVSCCVPNRNNVLDEQYLLLNIDELQNPIYDTSNRNHKNSIFKLVFREDTTHIFTYHDKDLSTIVSRYYQVPLAKLSSLTIRFKKYDGTNFDFGADTVSNIPVNEEVQNSITLKITVREPASEYIPNRNA